MIIYILKPLMEYYVYMLINENQRTYIGVTNNLEKRLLTHNSGKGAKATRSSKLWEFSTVVENFTKQSAMRFEWYWKHSQTKNGWSHTKSGLENKMKRLVELRELEEWSETKIKVMQ